MADLKKEWDSREQKIKDLKEKLERLVRKTFFFPFLFDKKITASSTFFLLFVLFFSLIFFSGIETTRTCEPNGRPIVRQRVLAIRRSRRRRARARQVPGTQEHEARD
jgi:hypothetical protein